MPVKAVPLSIIAPGFKGLNTQVFGSEDPQIALRAQNAVINSSGRLAARKGWTALTTSPLVGTPDLQQIHEYIDIAGNSTIISAAGLKLYSGTTALSDITGAITTPTANNWKFQNFNNVCVAFQSGHTPIVYTGSGNFADIVPASGTVPTGDEVLAAFGRLWAIKSPSDKTIIRFSDTLQYNVWDDHSAPGSSGSLNLKTVWNLGMDEIVALREFNEFLVIFGKRSLTIYTGANDPSTMSLVDIIQGTGCIARDSIQDIGTDLLFLSEDGVRSLARTIQEKSMPLTSISRNVRNDITSNISSERNVLGNVRSVYHEPEGFYLLNFPVAGITYVFDIRFPLEDGSLRTTNWDTINPKALFSGRDGTLYMGQAGVVAKYDGYNDNTSGTYLFDYLSTWSSIDQEIATAYKMPKSLQAVVGGGSTQTMTFKLAYDYIDSYKSYTATIPASTGAAEFGIAEFNVDEFSSTTVDSIIRGQSSGYGQVIQIGISFTVNGRPFSLQKLQALIKLGRFN